jgi:hypothetical protein
MHLFQELHSMRKHLLVAGIAAAALLPSFAFAQASCEQQHNNRVAGTVVGAGLGALLGSAVAGHGDKTTGAVIGGIGGAVVGNQVSKSRADCAHAYGYYDTNGAWHANSVERANAAGYYDRNGQWVDGAPNGYYDGQGRWVTASTTASTSGYYDSHGHWVPASAEGYYEADGQWVAASASGYYDGQGRWVAGPTTGHYDSNGRWMSGQASGHQGANGVWIADAEPGYYDTNGRWRAGQAVGYYDTRGRWIPTAAAAGGYTSNASYDTRGSWADTRPDIASREAWLDQSIRRGMDDGSLSRGDADRALRSLNGIRREEAGMRHYRGRLAQRDEARIQARLETLRSSIRWTRQDNRRNY